VPRVARSCKVPHWDDVYIKDTSSYVEDKFILVESSAPMPLLLCSRRSRRRLRLPALSNTPPRGRRASHCDSSSRSRRPRSEYVKSYEIHHRAHIFPSSIALCRPSFLPGGLSILFLWLSPQYHPLHSFIHHVCVCVCVCVRVSRPIASQVKEETTK
jgi:hypothetical protein